ncbi:hypothetical protein [Pyxidicoccus xibeiensis]|uniref:hypothetical protein n=1 Tax=Pyxidicoccus xibeiensis TaxID=2906759 RepID=UPI0020A7C01B|nr:hypothetical protein [Pyxidicoccus xibeiensis]MCP3141505.1 hypothetical protein [Pyxidicoccus xibeiensis]
MDYQKLFQVLVMGGALVGGATGCTQGNKESADRAANTGGTGGAGAAGATDAGTAGGPQLDDAGLPTGTGRGVKGW